MVLTKFFCKIATLCFLFAFHHCNFFLIKCHFEFFSDEDGGDVDALQYYETEIDRDATDLDLTDLDLENLDFQTGELELYL